MAKRLLADVLWEAANVRLSEDYDVNDAPKATCCAVFWAEHGVEWWSRHRGQQWKTAAKKSDGVQFLKGLGCPVGSSSAFERFEEGEERQGVRYMWLLLAMHVAEDEGIEIEVAHG